MAVKNSTLLQALRDRLRVMDEVRQFVDDETLIKWTGEEYKDYDLERAIEALRPGSILCYCDGTIPGSKYWVHQLGIILKPNQLQMGMDFDTAVLRGKVDSLDFADSPLTECTYAPQLVSFGRRETQSGVEHWDLKLNVEECC